MERKHSKENLIWSGKDYKSRTVNLFVYERDHILDRHGEIMGNNFTAVYDTVQDPDAVYNSAEGDDRKVYFKMSPEATYTPRYLTKTIVEFNKEETEGFIVTAMPSKKEGGSVGDKIYPEEGL